MTRSAPIAIIVSLLLACPSPSQARKKKSAKPAWKLSPDRGFIDDAFAFDRAGARFAFIHSDSATYLDISLLSLSNFAVQRKIKVPGATLIPKQLVFSDDGSRIVFVFQGSVQGKQGVMVFATADGKVIKKLAGATRIRVISYGGQQLISIARVKAGARGSQRVSVALHRVSDLRRVKAGRTVVRGDRTIQLKPPLRLLYWEPGMVELVGTQRGKYDKERDVRLPDVAVRYDIVKRRRVWRHTPQDLMVWNRALIMRAKHPGQTRFMHVSNNLKKLFAVDAANAISQARTPVAWRLYEPKSLKQREAWDRKRFYFSMTIDPVNPDAVKRKKADKERMDLYRLDSPSTVVPLGKVLTGKRRFSWAVGKSHFAYLRKLKGFGRGGKTIEIYRLKGR